MVYYIWMVFGDNHHRYVLCDGSHELNHVGVPHLLEHRQLMPERVSVTDEKKQDLFLSEIRWLVTLD
jgi:hypothetical protein